MNTTKEEKESRKKQNKNKEHQRFLTKNKIQSINLSVYTDFTLLVR
jgi:hypothetical protein